MEYFNVLWISGCFLSAIACSWFWWIVSVIIKKFDVDSDDGITIISWLINMVLVVSLIFAPYYNWYNK